MQKVLFLQGGWDGHKPAEIVQIFHQALSGHGFECEISETLDILADAAKLAEFRMIVPCWTMGSLTDDQEKGLLEAVRSGVALGGLHGGAGDAFRGRLGYEWMVGGLFVGHPHVGPYTVTIVDSEHPATAGLPDSFNYDSEQYYMLTDPGIHPLAMTDYLHEGETVKMPVAWTKKWGSGRVFYCSLGHDPGEFTRYPEAMRLSLGGLLWAAGKQ